jgi:hypothetical protein
MQDHSIGGNFVQKYFEGRAKTAKVIFFSDLDELRNLPLTITVIAENGEKQEFPYSIEKLFANAYRGFSLRHQGGSEGMDDATKEERKAERKAKNEKIKKLFAALAAKGQSIDDLLKD